MKTFAIFLQRSILPQIFCENAKMNIYYVKIVQILITENMTKFSGADFKNDYFNRLLTIGKVDMSFSLSMDIFFEYRRKPTTLA